MSQQDALDCINYSLPPGHFFPQDKHAVGLPTEF